VDGISKLFVLISLLSYCFGVLCVFIFVNTVFYEVYMYTHEDRTSRRLLYVMLLLLMVAIFRWRKKHPITGLEWPRGFQEAEAPRFHDNGTGWW